MDERRNSPSYVCFNVRSLTDRIGNFPIINFGGFPLQKHALNMDGKNLQVSEKMLT